MPPYAANHGMIWHPTTLFRDARSGGGLLLRPDPDNGSAGLRRGLL
jgi:hypothetical protein